MQNAPVKQDSTAFEAELRGRIESLELVEVKDASSFIFAGENVKEITATKNAWTEYWEPLRVSARATLDAILEKKKGPFEALEKKAKDQRALMQKWSDEEERKRREAERIAQEKAKKEADDAALAKAQALANSGNTAAAEIAIDNAPPPAPVHVRSSVPKGFGAALRKYYYAEVTDVMALARAVLAGTVPAEAIIPNQPFLNKQADDKKEALAFPGVVVKVR